MMFSFFLNCPLCCGLILIIIGAFARLLYILPIFRKKSVSKAKNKKVETMVVLGSGGHTTEMLAMMRCLSDKIYTPVHYIISKTDTTSVKHLDTKENKRKEKTIDYISRSREVGQSYFSSIFTTLYSFIDGIKVIRKYKPELLLVNGPGVSISIAYMILIFNYLGLLNCHIIFIESFCRVQSLSLSGMLMLPIADRFIVQWEELTKKYPRCEYLGILL